MVRSSSGLAVDKAKVGTRQGGVEGVTPACSSKSDTDDQAVYQADTRKQVRHLFGAAAGESSRV